MWTVLGLLCLAAFAVASGISRWNVDWSGERSGPGRFKRYTNKGKLMLLRVGMETPSELDFELKRESWIDGLAKSLGISREPQVGSSRFDELVYVISDDTRLTALLRQDPQLLMRVQRLVGTGVNGFEFKRLVCRRGQLWVNLKPTASVANEYGEVQWALGELQALSDALPALAPFKQRSLDRRFLHAVLVLGISGGLALNGVLQLVRLSLTHFPFTVDDGQLWSLALPLAVAIVCALLFTTLLLLGRSARVHLVLGQVLLFGGFGAIGTAFTELRDYNMEADPGPPVTLQAAVLGKHISHGRRSTSYYVELSDWNGGGRRQSVQVSSPEYRRFDYGMTVQVRQWPGALGVRWVESINPN
jgi:hypothetical protein